ncbi:hypothetical protein Ocin01_13097 [Orchesella cincta]|uniref:Uncharacterized protein n=1 Tax=Orchesella cincta TaxID=48709 RepID=A0A1D2MKP7_ORCCI|nr:hypothetical protein Ocin01_13097 [Orchesella cincta]
MLETVLQPWFGELCVQNDRFLEILDGGSVRGEVIIAAVGIVNAAEIGTAVNMDGVRTTNSQGFSLIILNTTK